MSYPPTYLNGCGAGKVVGPEDRADEGRVESRQERRWAAYSRRAGRSSIIALVTFTASAVAVPRKSTEITEIPEAMGRALATAMRTTPGRDRLETTIASPAARSLCTPAGTSTVLS